MFSGNLSKLIDYHYALGDALMPLRTNAPDLKIIFTIAEIQHRRFAPATDGVFCSQAGFVEWLRERLGKQSATEKVTEKRGRVTQYALTVVGTHLDTIPNVCVIVRDQLINVVETCSRVDTQGKQAPIHLLRGISFSHGCSRFVQYSCSTHYLFFDMF